MDEYDGLRKKNPIKKGEKTTIEHRWGVQRAPWAGWLWGSGKK